jgi:hypothetical protein
MLIDSKSGSERSVGSIPTARTIHFLQVPRGQPHVGWNLRQRSASGWAARAPLLEMTIEGYFHVGQETPERVLAIAYQHERSRNDV